MNKASATKHVAYFSKLEAEGTLDMEKDFKLDLSEFKIKFAIWKGTNQKISFKTLANRMGFIKWWSLYATAVGLSPSKDIATFLEKESSKSYLSATQEKVRSDAMAILDPGSKIKLYKKLRSLLKDQQERVDAIIADQLRKKEMPDGKDMKEVELWLVATLLVFHPTERIQVFQHMLMPHVEDVDVRALTSTEKFVSKLVRINKEDWEILIKDDKER